MSPDAGPRTLAVLVGGGPAPGLNGVIDAVTLAARARGWRVLGVPRGFSRLIQGDVSGVHELTADTVAGIATRGGSILYTSRANPTKRDEDLRAVVAALQALGVTDLVTLGGDDTATSAVKVAAAAGGGIRAVHVPKTIDNDLPLPGEAPTFGFETAKHVGAQLCRNLMVDGETTGRWYLVTAMGRSAGHLALAIGMAAGAHLTVIAEEFGDGELSLEAISDRVEAAILLRRAAGQDWGVVVLAEGLLDRMDPDEIARHATVQRDEHGHPRVSEIDLGGLVRDVLQGRFADGGPAITFVTKLIGYELRCADPVAFDVQYTRTLGYGAVEFLASGSGDALISLQGGRLVPIPFEELRDPATGKVRVRRVDTAGGTWQAARALQARLALEDLEGERLEVLATAAGTDPTALRARLETLL